MPIEWNDNLKTGIAIIDDQHQELLVMLNRLGRFRCGKESFFEALKDLQNYANEHFKTEEDYMAQAKYPKYEEHKSSHHKLIEDLDLYNTKLNQTNDFNSLGQELYDFVADWIINHYSNEDVELVKYIKQNT